MEGGCFGPVVPEYRSGLSFGWMERFVSSPLNPNLLKGGKALYFQTYRRREPLKYKEWPLGNLTNLWTKRRQDETKRGRMRGVEGRPKKLQEKSSKGVKL